MFCEANISTMNCVVSQHRLIEIPIAFHWQLPYTGITPKGRREEALGYRPALRLVFSVLGLYYASNRA
jgi:hypothetical protein